MAVNIHQHPYPLNIFREIASPGTAYPPISSEMTFNWTDEPVTESIIPIGTRSTIEIPEANPSS
jgi:hypothetical protein